MRIGIKMSEFSLDDFNFMNTSLFNIVIEGDHYFVDDLIRGVDNLDERLLLIEEPPHNDDLFRVFCANKCDKYEKLYLDKEGNISLSLVINIIK